MSSDSCQHHLSKINDVVAWYKKAKTNECGQLVKVCYYI